MAHDEALAARMREVLGGLPGLSEKRMMGGMCVLLTPITGIPLPFLSLGGSSLVTSLLAVGLVLSIAFRPVLVMASQDLNPEDSRRYVPLIDDHPGGALRIPNGPY